MASSFDTDLQHHQADVQKYFEKYNFTRPGLRILNMGCGSGILTEAIAKVMDKSSYIVGIDYDPTLLQCCATKLRAAGVMLRKIRGPKKPNGALYDRDITDEHALWVLKHSWEPELFDIIISSWAIASIKYKALNVSFWATIFLKDGGKMVLDIPHPRIKLDRVCLSNASSVTIHGLERSASSQEVSFICADHITQWKENAINLAQQCTNILVDDEPIYAYDEPTQNRWAWACSEALKALGDPGESPKHWMEHFTENWVGDMVEKEHQRLREECVLAGGNLHVGVKPPAVITRFFKVLTTKLRRDDDCPCGSGKNFEPCHGQFNPRFKPAVAIVFKGLN
jgi:SAM-dependent methyltransferase